jgi:SNF2 family DNA or RNA helicase
VLAVVPLGDSLKVIGRGLTTRLTHDPVLTPAQLALLSVSAEQEPFDGDAQLFRLGVEAHRLGLAYDYDPFFSLSIARVDPLPHQLEAVYNYFLRLPCIRFLLADEPGAGKTIMAGLLIRELKLRGLAEQVMVVCPANLAFQWQRELKEKFDEKFVVMKGSEIREQFGVNQWADQHRVITSLDLAKRTDILPGCDRPSGTW